MPDRPHWLSISDAGTAIRRGDLSVRELVTDSLAWIEESDSVTRAWTAVTAEDALEAADRADAELAAGEDRGPFHGMPVGVKDVVAVAGVPMGVGSDMVRDFVPRDDAEVVRRLRAAGGIVIGKTVTHEFAYGSTSPPTRNPWDGESVPGGSSGGSAAAVAAGHVVGAIGTDCCCSVRNPAALTGVCGIRPTVGRVSTTGVVPSSLGLDAVGPICRTTRDTATMLGAMAGYDPRDTRSSTAPIPDFGLHLDDMRDSVSGLRIGVPTDYFFEHIEPDVDARVRDAVELLKDLGAQIQPVDVPHAKHSVAVFFVICIGELGALQYDHLRADDCRLGEDVRRWGEIGSMILAKDYVRAQQMRSLIIADWERAFQDVDLVLTPATSAVAKKPVDHPIFIDVEYPDGFVEDVVFAYGRFLIPVSLAGLPGLVLPCGQDHDGLPIGLQLVAPAFDEATAFRVGTALEEELALGLAKPAALPA
jgi:aspartyl-tRNA(Asn)/glutamyl-tRNA(Gln) amidotransferase subunit A